MLFKIFRELAVVPYQVSRTNSICLVEATHDTAVLRKVLPPTVYYRHDRHPDRPTTSLQWLI